MRELLKLLVDAPGSSPWSGGTPLPHSLAAVAACVELESGCVGGVHGYHGSPLAAHFAPVAGWT